MNKFLYIPILTISAIATSACAESFPNWVMQPQDGLPQELYGASACIKNVGNPSLDKTISDTKARASMAASIEAMIEKELTVSRESTIQKTNSNGVHTKAQSSKLSATSDIKQKVKQLMTNVRVKDSVTLEKKGIEYTCSRVVTNMPELGR